MAAAQLLKFLGWGWPHVIPNELSHGHPDLLTNLNKRLDHVLVQWSLSHDPNQAAADTFLSYPQHSICIRYHIRHSD